MKNDFAISLSGAAVEIAPRLLGWILVRELDGETLIGRIVETEAYDQEDAASHSCRGETPRNSVMFGPSGRAYVYFTYGMHYCFNIVTGAEGYGCGVLVRAVEPLEGLEIMRRNRGRDDVSQLTNGPAKFCQAFGIDKNLSGHNLAEPPLKLELSGQIPNEQIVQTTRVGITKAIDQPWRFYIKSNLFVSKL